MIKTMMVMSGCRLRRCGYGGVTATTTLGFCRRSDEGCTVQQLKIPERMVTRMILLSSLEEHNNSLLHKEVLRLQHASKDKIIADKHIYAKALMLSTTGSVVEAASKRDLNELEFIQSVQEVIHVLERVISKNSRGVGCNRFLLINHIIDSRLLLPDLNIFLF